jgi:hypothetical protein
MYVVEPALPKAVQAMAIHPCGQNHNERIALLRMCIDRFTNGEAQWTRIDSTGVIYDQAAQPSTNHMKFQKKKITKGRTT